VRSVTVKAGGESQIVSLTGQIRAKDQVSRAFRLASAGALGMIPIAPTVLWGSMAYATMGASRSRRRSRTIFLPALYAASFRIKEPPRAPSRSADVASAAEAHRRLQPAG
jgi:hypothetical protein